MLQFRGLFSLVGVVVGVVVLVDGVGSMATSGEVKDSEQSLLDNCSWDTPAEDGGNTTTSSGGGSWRDQKLDFSISLFATLAGPLGGPGGGSLNNLFFSPHSIHQTLLLTLLGSGGETEAQLRALLRLGNTPKHKILEEYRADGSLRRDGTGGCPSGGGVGVGVGSKLYLDKGETLGPCLRRYLSPEEELEQLDLRGDPQGAITSINKWVEKRTGGKIPDLLSPTALSPSSRLAIVNGAYFHGVWEQQFKKSRTKLGLFYSSPIAIIPTQFMHVKGHFRHGASEELGSYVLELPYEGGSVSMVILLPPFTPSGLSNTLAALTNLTHSGGGGGGGALKRGMDDLVADSLEVILPRFKLSHTLSLTSSLRSLGLTALFSGGGDEGDSDDHLKGGGNSSVVDLSGFSSKPGLTVEEGIHKATLEVTEEGATAAGATALIGTRSGRPLHLTRFLANHPFILIIWDKCRESILFMGILHNPAQGQGQGQGEGGEESPTTPTTTTSSTTPK